MSDKTQIQSIFLFEFKMGCNGEGGGRGDQDGEDMWTQGLFNSMYDKIHYKKKKILQAYSCIQDNLLFFPVGVEEW